MGRVKDLREGAEVRQEVTSSGCFAKARRQEVTSSGCFGKVLEAASCDYHTAANGHIDYHTVANRHIVHLSLTRSTAKAGQ
jgi:hypothetical protein